MQFIGTAEEVKANCKNIGVIQKIAFSKINEKNRTGLFSDGGGRRTEINDLDSCSPIPGSKLKSICRSRDLKHCGLNKKPG